MQYGWSIRLAGFAPAGLIAACLAVPPAADEPETSAIAPEAASGALGAGAGTPIDWSQGDCLSQLRTLQQAASDGRLSADDRPPFAVQLVAAPGNWLDAVPQLPIETDLPLALDDAGAATEARCLIRIGPAQDQSAAHRAVDIQDVHSAYQSALRSERNPDYDAAQLAHREAKENAEGRHQLVRVGDPLLDLIGTTVGGLIGTVDRRVREHEVDDAAAELAATPRSRDQPVYRPYSFERIVVRAQKQAVVPIALLDASGRELRRTELRQSERREFFVLQGLDPRDRDYEQHRSSSMTRADLARWARTPPALRLSSVAIALTEGPAAEHRVPDIAPAAGPALPEPMHFGQPSGLEPTPEHELEPRSDDAASAAGSLAAPLLEDWVDEPESDPALLTAPGPDSHGALGIAGLEPRPADSHTVAPERAFEVPREPQAPSVVLIRAGRAAGSGFYVRENLVLTTYQLVRAISVADITTADGATVPALVAAVDPSRDLALLQMPRPGPPAALYEGSMLPPVRPLDTSEPGLPVLVDGQVVGMTTGAAGAAGQEVVSIDAIRVFLDNQAALLAAVP
jgi:Trypsin-like peptidase domain